MEQVGLVVETKDDKAIVAVQRHDVCSKCGGCGAALSGGGETHLEALNKANAVVGQTVRITSDTAQVLKATFVVYMIPLLSLLAGLYIGQQLDGTFGASARLDIVLGIILLLVSYLLVRLYDRKLARRRRALAAVVEILEDEPYTGPGDEKC